MQGTSNWSCWSTALLQNPTAVRSIETDLIRSLVAAVAIPLEGHKARPAQRDRAGRSRLLARLLEYVRATDPLDLSIPQLCEDAGVDQRGLEYACRQNFDLTPVAFLKLRRLHSARRRLIAADPMDMAVTDIAYQEGFYHRGRFAAAYLSAFGEHPSETLRRACPQELRTLMAVRPLQITVPVQSAAWNADRSGCPRGCPNAGARFKMPKGHPGR